MERATRCVGSRSRRCGGSSACRPWIAGSSISGHRFIASRRCHVLPRRYSASLRDALRKSTPYVTATGSDTRSVVPLPPHACAIQFGALEAAQTRMKRHRGANLWERKRQVPMAQMACQWRKMCVWTGLCDI
jgi:hypothetical protein